MAKSMDDCFLSSHRIDIANPARAPRRTGPSYACIAGFVCLLQVSFVLGSGVALAVIDDADCEPMQMDHPFQHRPELYLQRLYPLQQSWPGRKARYTAVTAMSNETPRTP